MLFTMFLFCQTALVLHHLSVEGCGRWIGWCLFLLRSFRCELSLTSSVSNLFLAEEMIC